MDHETAGRYWNDNAEVWTTLARRGYDVYRDHLNTPAFFAALPDVRGLRGLDLGCGEGHNTRLLAGRGAQVCAIDISEIFVAHARAEEERSPLGIAYRVASMVALPFEDGSFDFAIACMSLMEPPETEQVLAEAFRVLRPGGFLHCSIEHPCFATRHRRNLRDATGATYAFEIGDYFRPLNGEIEEWIFGAAPAELKEGMRRFRIPRFTRTLSTWLTMMLQAGFVLEYVGEPRPSDETVRAYPSLQDAQVIAYFLHLRLRKPVER